MRPTAGLVRAARALVAGIASTTLLAPTVTWAQLPAAVADALKAAAIPESAMALVVLDTRDGATLATHQATMPMHPASVMKLVTSMAALDLLDPAYRWRTTVARNAAALEAAGGGASTATSSAATRATPGAVAGASTGEPTVERLDGPLWLRCSGDPLLTRERLRDVLLRVRTSGLAHLEGDVLLDRSAFAPATAIPFDAAAFDGRPLRPYNAGPDACLFALRTVQITFRLGDASQPVRVSAEPDLAPIATLTNALTFDPSDRPCDAWDDDGEVDATGTRWTLRGAVPKACFADGGLFMRWYVPYPADVFAHGLIAQLWRELGGTWNGRVREATPSTAGDATRVLASFDGASLAEALRELNKFSNNVIARQVFLTLGRERGGGANLDAARQVVASWVAAKGVTAPELFVDNGSGLSRTDRIAARTLGALLVDASRGPYAAELVASLPIAALDGTLRRRLLWSPAAGRAHLKTGSVDGVRAIAGYVHGPDGRTLALVAMVNHANAAKAQRALDAAVSWAAAQTGLVAPRRDDDTYLQRLQRRGQIPPGTRAPVE